MKPNKLGYPCWEKTNIPRAISSVAQVDVAHIDYFLSSHTPIEGIVNDDTDQTYSEEEFFQELMSPTHGQVLAVVHGDPGTGKSHLIHWLKLRCEDALNREELKNIVPVLVQRRSGSLKDALEQIVNQLPDVFSEYLTRIQDAIGSISEGTARLKLAQMLFLELSPGQRATRKRESLPRDLRDLPEVCNSTGFRDWLSRGGGVIDRNIKRLDQGSEVEERDNEAFPFFTESDFLLPTQFKGKDTPQVLDLADEFEEDEELRERAAGYLNEVLPDALREMTGLSDAGLRDIFDKIRKQLKSTGKELALFIEDVSVMSALDEEVFVAVEPQPRADLCRMVAVLGLTNQGWGRLRDNHKTRVDFPVNVDGKTNRNWMEDRIGVAKFASRYLNTVRLDPQEVSELAAHRRDGKGLTISACTNCPVREECHSTFGNVTIDDLPVGTFPFTVHAPQKLLTHLDQHATTRRNARGLLSTIIRPVLDAGYDQLESRNFPAVRLAVSLPEPSFWTAFEHEYCGGWGSEDKNRVKLLVQGWTKSDSTGAAASSIKPLLEPLGLPSFSKAVRSVTPVKEAKVEQVPTPPPPPPASDKLNQIVGSLRKWTEGEELVGDAIIRDLLVKFFRTSIPWNDEHYPPLDVWKNLVHDKGNKIYRIEGMRSNPANVNFRIDFARNEENRSFFEALAQFEYAGRGSWNFEHAELHKRTIHTWLRRNTTRIINSLQPPEPLSSNKPLSTAVQILTLAALIRRRARPPADAQDAHLLVKEILIDFPPSEYPSALSSELKTLISDLAQRHKELKRFVISELSSPQGRTGGARFINPLPIVTTARQFLTELQVDSIDNEFFQGALLSRYSALNGTSIYSDLPAILHAEQIAIRGKLDDISFELRAFGIDTADLTDAVVTFCNSVPEIVGMAKKADIVVISEDFNEIYRQSKLSQRRDVWATALRQAVEQLDGENIERALTFDSSKLSEFHSVLKTVFAYLERVDHDATKILENFETEGDPDTLAAELINHLNLIKTEDARHEVSEEVSA